MGEQISNFNHLNPTGFKVTISREFYPHLQYFAQSVQHPGLEVAPVELGYKGVSNVPFTGNSIQNSSVTMDILMDENMESYKEMYDWMLRMTNEKHKLSSRRFTTDRTNPVPTSYCDISLSILTSSNNANKLINYRNAFPISIGDIQLNVEATEYITFPVSFRFDYFTFS